MSVRLLSLFFMNVRQKLEVIQKMGGFTQTELANKIGVSFVALNSWWNQKSTPRPKKLALIDEFYLEITGQKIIPEDQLEAKKQALKNRGYKYTENNVAIIAAILFDNVVIPGKSLTEHLEAKNHQEALFYMFEYILDGGRIDEKFVLRLHSILMNGILHEAGFYRNHGVRIVGVYLPTANYLKIPDLMPELMMEAAKSEKDIIKLATNVHSRFEKIHPFSDGNGRVGRLLLNAMLLKANLAPAIIRQEKKQLYYTYLYKAQTTEDHSLLEDFICDSIVEGFDILERKYVQDFKNLILKKKIILAKEEMQIIDLLLFGMNSIRVSDVEDFFAVSKFTAQIYLSSLEKKGLIKRHGPKSSGIYTLLDFNVL
ncbi:MAG: Filamentation induced by cAMP protein Fic [Candidatus Peregrinibacteria bacterium GW2011_GWA2_33_10]|nr:MAG: Filamentation induced by cAMP protein Fic [Candidatus Peregrinibacteria bacterium GW2011_GWA2_33_10]